MTPTRGERNNNPGNIREHRNDGVHWQGERAIDDDPDFEEFVSPESGIRALARVLLSYQRKHQLNTVRQIISRWAPTNENNTNAYIGSVATQIGKDADETLNLEDRGELCALVRAVIRHENGRVIYTDDRISEGVDMALA